MIEPNCEFEAALEANHALARLQDEEDRHVL